MNQIRVDYLPCVKINFFVTPFEKVEVKMLELSQNHPLPQVLRGICNFGTGDLPRLWRENGAGGRRCLTANKFDLSVDPVAVVCQAKHIAQLTLKWQAPFFAG